MANANTNGRTAPFPVAATGTNTQQPLSAEAQRALAEAQARRAEASTAERPKEIAGRAGPDPVRYGDWENKGIASDF